MSKTKITRQGAGAWALVTGAGSGIGRCYALQLAARSYNIVLVGSTIGSLLKVKEEIRAAVGEVVEVIVIELDLARVGAAEELFGRTQAQGIEIEVLVNNAGIFSFCDILQTPAERIERIILLHDLTLTKLCRLYGGQLARRAADDGGRRVRRGYILNMSSYSMWMPLPGLSLYSASKAYVRSFSVAFAKEVRRHGIRVTAVCPAGVATDLFGLTPQWQKIARRAGALITPETCARRALKALWHGRRTIVPDWWNRLWIPLFKILPMCVIRPIQRFTMKFQK